MRPEILKKAMRSLLNMTIRKGFCLSDQRYAEAESINGYVDLTVSKISKICVPEFPYSHQCLELMVDILRIYVEDKPIATLALSNIRWLMRPEDSLDFSQATCCMKASLRRRLVENVIETMEVYEKDSPPLFMSGALLLCFLGDSVRGSFVKMVQKIAYPIKLTTFCKPDLLGSDSTCQADVASYRIAHSR
jgi:hypothetical protein